MLLYAQGVSHPVPSPFHLCRSSEQHTMHVVCAADQKDIFVLLLLDAAVKVFQNFCTVFHKRQNTS